jgi:biotin carboxyl carrier protein
MDYEFLLNNRINRLTVNNNPDGGFEIALDGDPIELQVSQLHPNILTLRIGNRLTTAYIAKQDGKFFVHIDGKSIELAFPDAKQKKYSKEGMEFGAKDEITTPMPGKIVRLLVKVGDIVKPGQPLVIVESMKMENEIKSSMEGAVKAVNFKPGDLVNPGQTIIKLSTSAE